MKYSSGAEFRRALEDRLRARSLATGMPLVRLRKMVAFDRFLARLVGMQPQEWVLKGGFLLQLRIGDRARTTKDIDLLAIAPRQDIRASLQEAGALDKGDWFEFEVGVGSEIPPVGFGGVRHSLRALLDGRTFERFHIDIGIDDPLVVPIEHLETPPLLEFAGIPSTTIPCYPIVQQIAEKVHAFSQIYSSGESTRVKDLVDILLMAGFGEISAQDLQMALKATFDVRKTHSLPATMPTPPRSWASSFRRMVGDVGLSYATLESASEALQRFLNPILGGQHIGVWDPEQWGWK